MGWEKKQSCFVAWLGVVLVAYGVFSARPLQARSCLHWVLDQAQGALAFWRRYPSDVQLRLWQQEERHPRLAGMRKRRLLESLARASVVADRTKELEAYGCGGAKSKLRLDNGLTGLWKPDVPSWTRVENEILASDLDQVWGLGIVPLTLRRTLNGCSGSLQVFVDGAEFGNSVKDPRSHRRYTWMKVFDFLIANGDRHGANFLLIENRVVAIDHGLAFQPAGGYFPIPPEIPEEAFTDRELYERLSAVSDESLRRLLDRRLEDQRINEILDRKNRLLREMEGALAGRRTAPASLVLGPERHRFDFAEAERHPNLALEGITLTHIRHGRWATFHAPALEAGTYGISVDVSMRFSARIEVRAGAPDGALLGEVSLPSNEFGTNPLRVTGIVRLGGNEKRLCFVFVDQWRSTKIYLLNAVQSIQLHALGPNTSLSPLFRALPGFAYP